MSGTLPLEKTFPEKRESLVQPKTTVEVELIMTDGTSINGQVYRAAGQRVLDLLNDPQPFFPVRLPSGEIILVAKSSVAICKPIDQPM
jgi:hypothetical protein